MKAKIAIILSVFVVVALALSVLRNSDNWEDSTTTRREQSAENATARTNVSAATIEQKPASASEPDGTPEVIGSLYEADRDLRDAGLAAAEAEMTKRLSVHPDGWLRWQAVWIDSLSVTNGNYLDEELVAKEFIVSPFPGETYKATRTVFRPREATASATWEGVLDDGKSGVIEMTLMAMEHGKTVVRIRIRTPTAHYTILPTDVYGAYVSAEANGAFWRSQIAY